MRKNIGRAISRVLLYLIDCVGTFINFGGSERLCPLYFNLSQAVRKIQDWTNRNPQDDAMNQEGLGAVYDRRKWRENYYGKRPLQS